MAQVVAVVAVHGGENDEDNGGALNEGGGNIYFIPRFSRALRCNYSTEWTNATLALMNQNTRCLNLLPRP